MQLGAEAILLKGTPICRGIAIGKPFFLARQEFAVFETAVDPQQTEREVERYRAALARSKQDIKRLQKQLEMESAMDGILILEAQMEMLHDPLLTGEIEQCIRFTHKNADFVLKQALLKFQEQFQALDDSFFAERFKDLQDLASRIFGYLNENEALTLKDVCPKSIVCALELSASDAAGAFAGFVAAFITQSGGTTSHTAIVAKAKGIPYITNIDLDELRRHAGETLIVDGRTGKIIINPNESTLKYYENVKRKMTGQMKAYEEAAKWPAQTYDGYFIRLTANLDSTHELDLIHQLGGQGIGLFRSEYLFLPHYECPSEEEQFQVYYHLVERMNKQPVVVRTFDLSGDKASLHPVQTRAVLAPSSRISVSRERPDVAFCDEGIALAIAEEKNAADDLLAGDRKLIEGVNSAPTSSKNNLLGSRSPRHLLKEKSLLKTQLRALLRASQFGPLSILFPMVATLTELREAKQLVHEVAAELNMTQLPPLGCMIEVPSAAMMVDHFVQECDFLSIGTNDLVQYSLAADRSDQILSEFYEPTDPSVIRLIKIITHEANKAKIPVSICGEIASDPRFTPLLLGLGIQELSVSPRHLSIVKNAIRSISIVEAVQLAEKTLSLKTGAEVLQLLVQEYQKNVPHDLLYNAV